MRRRRAHLKMSQNQLAEAAGVHARQIRGYESGEQQPLLTVAIAIAEALGLSVDELAGVTRDPGDLCGDWRVPLAR
jgi:transcriptional regulator with XRE-family HTH domain